MTNVIDFRPNELETVHTEKTVHRLEITQHELDKQSEGIACLK